LQITQSLFSGGALNEHTAVWTFYTEKTAAFYSSVHCHDDFYFGLRCGRRLFRFQFCRQNTLCRCQFHYAVSHDTWSCRIYVWNRRQCTYRQNHGRGWHPQSKTTVFPIRLYNGSLRHCHRYSGNHDDSSSCCISWCRGRNAWKLRYLWQSDFDCTPFLYAAIWISELFCHCSKTATRSCCNNRIRTDKHAIGCIFYGSPSMGCVRCCGCNCCQSGSRWYHSVGLFQPTEYKSAAADQNKMGRKSPVESLHKRFIGADVQHFHVCCQYAL